VDLSSRLRAIVRPSKPIRELTYEPDTGKYESTIDIGRVGELLGGRATRTDFGECLVIDRRYESDRWHGDVRIGDCELPGAGGLRVLDPHLTDPPESRALFIDLDTTGISGGAGTVAFLVGVGYFDLGAFQVRQFLLTSYAAERALLAAVSELFDDAGLIVTYNGKTFDVPVMETRWVFHRMEMSLEGVPHFDMLHPARRLWRSRGTADALFDDGGCRLTTLERALFEVRRVGDVEGVEIPGRFFQFLRTGDPRPLEPVLEHNRLDLVSLAAVTARAARLAADGAEACRDGAEALALGRIYERAETFDRAEDCYRRAAVSEVADVRGEALYRLGIRCRRERRFAEAADVWREVMVLTASPAARRRPALQELGRFAAEALAIHHEHRARDYDTARELALFALEDLEDRTGRRADGVRHRLARLDRKISKKRGLFDLRNVEP
jgi:uncharacterized protein YprB with RNaseH-like and TPR domain